MHYDTRWEEYRIEHSKIGLGLSILFFILTLVSQEHPICEVKSRNRDLTEIMLY
jgi:hypothetical protein